MAERLVGTGYELGVFREGTRLTLGIPVDSGHRNFAFEFGISDADLAVLQTDPYRRKALDLILHAGLQLRLTRGDHDGLEAEFLPVIERVLYGPQSGIAAMIDASPQSSYIRYRLAEAGF